MFDRRAAVALAGTVTAISSLTPWLARHVVADRPMTSASLGSVAMIALLAACGGTGSDAGPDAASPVCGDTPTPIAVSPSHRVIPVYLVAPDTSASDVDVRAEYFDRSLAAIQRWYGEKMGAPYNNATFAY